MEMFNLFVKIFVHAKKQHCGSSLCHSLVRHTCVGLLLRFSNVLRKNVWQLYLALSELMVYRCFYQAMKNFLAVFTALLPCVKQQNAIKDPHWYDVQVSDTTMLIKEPSAGTIKISLPDSKC